MQAEQIDNMGKRSRRHTELIERQYSSTETSSRIEVNGETLGTSSQPKLNREIFEEMLSSELGDNDKDFSAPELPQNLQSTINLEGLLGGSADDNESQSDDFTSAPKSRSFASNADFDNMETYMEPITPVFRNPRAIPEYISPDVPIPSIERSFICRDAKVEAASTESKRAELSGTPAAPARQLEPERSAISPLTPPRARVRASFFNPRHASAASAENFRVSPSRGASIKYQSPLVKEQSPQTNLPSSATRIPSLKSESPGNIKPIVKGEEITMSNNEATVVDVDSDNDFTIIDPKFASAEAKRRWAEPYKFTSPAYDDSPIFVKSEPRQDAIVIKELVHLPGNNPKPSTRGRLRTPSIPRILPSHPNPQKVPVNSLKYNNRRGYDAFKVDGEPSAFEGRNKRRREADGQHVPDDPEHVDAAMRDAEEDHSWMDEDDGDDEEYAQLKEQKAALDVKAKNGKITQNEVMILRKFIKQIKHIERLKAAAARGRQNDGESDNDDSIFVPLSKNQIREDIVRSHHQKCPKRSSPSTEENLDLESSESAEAAGVVGDDADQEDAHFHAMLQQALNGQDLGEPPLSRETGNGKSRKPRKKVAKNARDVVLQKRQKEREKERMKSQRKKARDAGKKNGSANVPKGRAGKAGKSVKGNGAKSSSRAESSRMFSGYSGRTDPIAQMMLDDLFRNDPIQDRISNPIFNVSEEPQIQETKKETQFQRLFANIPSGSSEQDAKSDKKKLQLASKAFGYARVKARNGKWLVKGMKSTLYHHQLLGAQWMLSRELSESSPQGGLLADGMGLGKTVQTIACMVGNPPTEDDKTRQITATLIVVPSSVINQWLSEIREHAEGKIFPKLLHYKTKLRLSMEVLRDIDVVLTSYNEVMQQFPFPNQKGREEIARVGYAKWWKKASKSLGILHRITWYRVVLDEAHTIKNNSARTSLACQNLKSVYRWCLTGTPILNRLEELFPYLRFLKAHFAMDWDTFRNYFCDAEGEESQKRIATILSFTMMRRTMATTILNRPIIHLPKPHPEIQYVDFSTQERIIYRITENRFRANLNLYFAGNRKDTRNAYANFLVQLLRLRQCTSHPWMLEQTIKDAWTSEDVTELRGKLRRLKMTDTPFYEQCQLWVSQSKQERDDAQAARDRGEDVPEAFPAMPFGRGNFGHEFKMDKALETLNDAEMFARVVCAICSDMPQSPKITDCGHIFCEECITTYMHKMVAEYEDHTFSCPSCDKMFTDLLPYSGPRMMDDDDFSPEPSPETNRPGSTKQPRRSIYNKKKPPRYPNSKGRDALGFEPLTLPSAWLTRSDRDDKFPLTPSAKTTALKAILLKGFKEAPADKVVIYTQFRILARIVGRLCASENWGFLYLTGDSSLEHRGQAVRRFQKDPSVKILIAGLKCGGLGLNFPWANRCISLDLWWNHAVEQQAFGRIFRIGQTKETWMTRIVVRNTVDMRLLRMQMHKLKTCEQAVGDGDKKDQAALSIEDVASLFGFLRTDEDGMILEVVPDYISEDGDDEGEIEDDENGGEDTSGRTGT